MKIAKILAVAMLLGGCATQRPPIAADGYRFDGKEWEEHEITVRVVIAKNDRQMLKLAREVGGLRESRSVVSARTYRTHAFAALNPNDHSHCTIYVLDPGYNYEPEYIGHEFSHCVWGRWHHDELPDN